VLPETSGEFLTDKVMRAFISPCFGWQPQDVRSLNWETELCSCNNNVDPSNTTHLCGS